MKNIMNFRITLCCIISLLVAVICATFLFVTKNSKLIVFFILAILFIIFLICWFKFRLKVLAVITVTIFVVSLPILSLYFKCCKIEKIEKFDNKEVMVYGRICENWTKTNSGSVKVILDNVEIFDDEESEKVDGKVIVYISSKNLEKSNLKIGRFIYAHTRINVFNLKDDISKSASFLSRGYVAVCSSYFYEISYTDTFDVTLRDKIKNGVYENAKNIDVDYFDIGYSMLFGDTTKLDYDTKSIFQTTGIAHLLAVSGFHVSVILLILNFILRKMKSPLIVNIILTSLLILFYAYLCEFSVSVIRASLMALFALYAKYRNKPYDNLSVLSLIAVILLLINPLELFNISFVLSFVSVLSIILLVPIFTRFFSKYFYDRFASMLALNLSVQFGVLATSIYYFGYFNPLSILANFVSVPIAMLSFIVFIFVMLLSAISPIFTFTGKLFEVGMGVIVKFNYFIMNLNCTINFEKVSVIIIPIMILLMFICSDYVFVNRRNKVLSSMILVATIGLLLSI